MNNDEKREFISAWYVLHAKGFPYLREVEEKYFNNLPKKLYKYKPFDKYFFDMLNNQKIYLPSASKLDDTFECNIAMDIEKIYDVNSGYMTSYGTNLIFEHILDFLDTEEKRNLAENVYRKFLINGNFNNQRALEFMNGCNLFTQDEKRIIVNAFANYQSVLLNKAKSGELKSIINMGIKPKDKVGIFSLSSENNNIELWDKYADGFRGCCVEFDLVEYECIFPLFPVIYGENKPHNLVENLIIFNANVLVREFSDGKILKDISQLYAPLVTKDLSKWSYQHEWRILGNPNSFIKSPKISAIYLGCNASDENIKKMKKLSKNIGFKLYKLINKETEVKFEELIM